MVNYAHGKIYKIVDLTNDNIYIGSTCEPKLARRLAQLISGYKSYINGKSHFVTSYKILENGNYDIQLIESYACCNKDELHAREGLYINTMACINKIVAGRTPKEYYEHYKDAINYKKKEKYICLCGGIVSHTHKARHNTSQKHINFIDVKDT